MGKSYDRKRLSDMPDSLKIDSRRKMCLRLFLPLWCALVAVPCGAQDAAKPPTDQVRPAVQDDLKNAINEVRGGDYAYVDQIVEDAGEKDSDHILQSLFAENPDAETKCIIASALIKVGNRDDRYWSYLVSRARDSLDIDIPNPVSFGEDGKEIKGKISPEFDKWAKSQENTDEPWAKDPFFGPMLPLGLLGGTGDPRAIPLLRRGLLARSYLIEAVAAEGLAELHDKDSIQLILDACKRAPADAAFGIAMMLLQFNDPEAQAAAEPFFPKDLVQKLHDQQH